ncbi:MAG: hypothetical protein Q9220_007359 [cf. Caloplaca sp. 1 TL-2023]
MILLIPFLPLPYTLAHSGHDDQAPLSSSETDWATQHMASEHHISNFDPGAFFTLHDFDSSLSWSVDEIRKMYGLDDPSIKDVDESKKAEVVRTTLEEWDVDRDGVVERGEWMEGWRGGKRLRDFGVDTREEDLTHPEDIEHFRKHDEMEAAAEHQEELDRMPIVEQNIPQKFRRY